jgi:hypothetical protein
MEGLCRKGAKMGKLTGGVVASIILGFATGGYAQPAPQGGPNANTSTRAFTEYDCANQTVGPNGQLSFAPVISGGGGVGSVGEFGITPGILLQTGTYRILLHAGRLQLVNPPPPAPTVPRFGGQLTIVVDDGILPVVKGRWLMSAGFFNTATVAASQTIQVTGQNQMLRFRYSDGFASAALPPGIVVWPMHIGDSCRLILTRLR